MRVVVDTNVLARATPGRNSPARQVLDLLVTPPHVLVASEFLLEELGRKRNPCCISSGMSAQVPPSRKLLSRSETRQDFLDLNRIVTCGVSGPSKSKTFTTQPEFRKLADNARVNGTARLPKLPYHYVLF